MSIHAKCHNYTGCLLAYRGEEISLAAGAPLVCPECGKPVTVVHKNAKFLRMLVWSGFFAILGIGALVTLPILKSRMDKNAAREAGATPTPVATARPATTPVPKRATPSSTPTARLTPSTPPPLPEVASQPIVPARIELNPDRQETKAVREDVLKRIDLIPNITPVNKDKLYSSVLRARSMGLVLTLPFASGRTAIAAADVPALKTALDSPEVTKLRDDPTAVFVVLGYADPKGDDKKNLRISQERADSIVAAMRDKCGVVNVSHAVAMGGSTLHDAQNLEKNRIVEIWAVLP